METYTIKRAVDMDVNYYWHKKYTGINEPEEGLHIGKKSGGWSFSFRAYQDEPFIESRRQWRLFFEREGGVIVNEYGDVKKDSVAWINQWEAPSKDQQKREIDPRNRGSVPFPTIHSEGMYVGQPSEWHDEEGFRFYDGDFC